jgi:hypothetical protein
LHQTDQALERLLDIAKDPADRDADLAMELQDAMVAKLLSGAPMVTRASSLVWVQGPGQQGECENRDCRKKDCRGSRVVVGGEEEDVQLVFEHHKTDREVGQHVVTFTGGTPLAKAFHAWTQWAWQLLRGRNNVLKRMFVAPGMLGAKRGGFLGERAFNLYANEVVRKGTGLDIGVRGWREVGGTELNQLVPDVHVKEGLAMGMGTSLKTWKSAYVGDFREVQTKHSIQAAETLLKGQLQQVMRMEREEEDVELVSIRKVGTMRGTKRGREEEGLESPLVEGPHVPVKAKGSVVAPRLGTGMPQQVPEKEQQEEVKKEEEEEEEEDVICMS